MLDSPLLAYQNTRNIYFQLKTRDNLAYLNGIKNDFMHRNSECMNYYFFFISMEWKI